MIKNIISSIILSGGLFIAGQAIGQVQSEDQILQRSDMRDDSALDQQSESVSGTDQQRFRDTDQRRFDRSEQQDDSALDQESEFFSGTDQQRFRDTDQRRFDQRRFPERQTPLQEEFGVSPRFDTRGDFESRQRQDQREDRPGGFSDTTREQDSPALRGPGQVQGQSGSTMQSGPGSSGGGFGGQGGSGGQGQGGSGGQ